jgi:hypothetical protein
MTGKTQYTKEMGDIICERLACGESMRSVSRDETMPAMSTLFKWLREAPGFSEQYEKAKLESADALVEDMLDIADNQAQEEIEVDGVSVKAATGPSVAHARLRVDTRKWAASKLKPKKYGDRMHTEHSGSIDLASMSDEELQKRLNSLQNQISESE